MAIKLDNWLIDTGVAVPSILIEGVAIDSRQIEAGYAFLAIENASAYIPEAIERGAAVILHHGQSDIPAIDTIPLIQLNQLPQIAGQLIARFFGDPSKESSVIGITGTNGKTSVSHFIAQALATAGYDCGVIGTLGTGLWPHLTASRHTTPNKVTVQNELANFHSVRAPFVSMEVSSHGIAQGRIDGTHFDTAVFTNLSRDHLDYHGSMSDYGAIKRRLFFWPGLKAAVINVDDEFGKNLLEDLQGKVPTLIGYSQLPRRHPDVPMVVASMVDFTEQGIHMEVRTPWGSGEIQTALTGRFNVSNVLAALAVLGVQGIDFNQSLRALSQLSGVPGRMQCFRRPDSPSVVVDYAHTPDALIQALITLREQCSGQLYCVFGCGGNRDQGKRAEMGRAAEYYADQVVLTNDNPRSEPAEEILADILQGFKNPSAVRVDYQREEAVMQTVAQAQAGDVVLVAGKGHENYQLIRDQRLSYSDIEVAQRALAEYSACCSG